MDDGQAILPRLLIIDDVFGRRLPDRRNTERADLCGALLLKDVTGDEVGKGEGQRIWKPLAEAVFFRGQQPTCSPRGVEVENDLEGCLRVVRSGWSYGLAGAPRWAMVLLDLCFYTGQVTAASDRAMSAMPAGRASDSDPNQYFGLRILSVMRAEFPDLPVVILSSKPREEVSRMIAARGALGFIAAGDADTASTLEDYLWRHGLIPDLESRIVGRSPEMLLALRAARRAATFHDNTLIQGESGTGKELLAAYLHRSSPQRSAQPFVVVNSGALSPELFASELFGHRRGAFTGAIADRVGQIVRANEGDLFLDEIATMTPDVQGGVLRVLQDRLVQPVGGNSTQEVNVRFLSATNEDIDGKALLGQFRKDLLERLRVGGVIRLPPLRARREDIPLLVEKFLREAIGASRHALIREVTPEAMEMLQAQEWPGNIRVLEGCVRKAVAAHPDVEYLYPHHFELPGTGSRSASVVVSHATQALPLPSGAGPGLPLEPPRPGVTPSRLDDVLQALDKFSFESLPRPDLVGSLSKMFASHARFLIKLMKAALDATSRPTPDCPTGKVLIHPAMKLLTNDPELTASAAADLIKRLLAAAPEATADLVDDPVVREACSKALQLRPRSPRKGASPRPGGAN